MREHKFRTFFHEEKIMCMPFTLDEALKHDVDFLDKKRTDMQYTGLEDKNGVEIYEGDIVSINGDIDFIAFEQGSFILANFTTDEGALVLASSHIHEHECINDLEVIGNIYENPELLEQ